MTLIADHRPVPGLARFARDANWLTAERARIFARLWLAMTLIAAVAWVLLAHHDVDLQGKPLGTDFASFWTASRLALSGHSAQAYDLDVHHAAQTQVFGRDVGYYAFFYPPVFLLICLPLAMLPYLASLGVWLVLTGAAYGAVVRRFAGEAVGWAAIFAFPAVLVNVGHGQNGFLSAALFGGGVLLLDRRPLLAGALLGCLIYKPHLGLVIPVALLAGGRWRAILGAALAVLALCASSVAVFGLEAWRGFLADSPIARAALEQGLVGDAKMQSAFAAVRLLHGGLPLAYGVQALVMIGACAALVHAQRTAPRAEAEGPAMATAALLASPFLLDYDLILLAIPLAWLTAKGLKSGFLPWEKIILASAFMAPAVSRNIASATGVPLGPLVVAAVFWLVLRRWVPAKAETPLAAFVGPSRPAGVSRAGARSARSSNGSGRRRS
jgi:hypothetical protein